MVTDKVHFGDIIEARQASVAYQLVETPRGILLKHAAIVAVEGSVNTRDQLGVLDWPQSAYALTSAQIANNGVRFLEESDYDIVLGWVESSEDARLPDAEKIIDEARFLLSNTLSLIHGALWRPYPSRQRPYVFSENQRTEVEFAGSCVGFVEECYEKASNIDLVADNESTLPEWTVEELSQIWHLIVGDHRPRTVRDLEEYLSESGIPNPCRMLFPGYQHAAFRDKSYPFVPQSSDDAFL